VKTAHAPKGPAAFLILATIIVSGYIGVQWDKALRRQPMGSEGRSPFDPIHVPLWLPTSQVLHRTRFACVWDGQAPLARFRQAESLDAVVAGAASDEERARKLLHWTREQFEPGRPDPYPPPDAMKTLSEIRAGRTGGFCAQYAFVLVQALQSFGKPSRVVTIVNHEVVETWLQDQGRWTMLDPLFELQVFDSSGRSLSAIEIRNGRNSGATLAITAENRLTEPLRQYVARYDRIALWIRNAFVSAPMNFADFDRYRVWLVRANEVSPTPESLSTTHPEGLYGPPNDFPRGARSGASAAARQIPTANGKDNG
jgi:transglutaminase superfamily protein